MKYSHSIYKVSVLEGDENHENENDNSGFCKSLQNEFRRLVSIQIEGFAAIETMRKAPSLNRRKHLNHQQEVLPLLPSFQRHESK